MKKEKTIYSKEIVEELDIQEIKNVCNSCNKILPLILDNRICPNCQKRTG